MIDKPTELNENPNGIKGKLYLFFVFLFGFFLIFAPISLFINSTNFLDNWPENLANKIIWFVMYLFLAFVSLILVAILAPESAKEKDSSDPGLSSPEKITTIIIQKSITIISGNNTTKKSWRAEMSASTPANKELMMNEYKKSLETMKKIKSLD